ncbi:acyl carrier protein [Streptomyces sp. OZ13]|uniref:acyl carrier protein n=1 Tax=Streptomyces sp. OZ13 TaxID=3452210 RepID=UPI003F8A46BF
MTPMPETPSTPHEPAAPVVLVRTAWAEGLGHDEFDDDDNFFAVGGHSMCAVRIVRALKDRLGHPLTVRQFLAHPTVNGLAAHLAGAAGSDTKTGPGPAGAAGAGAGA